MQCPRVNFNWPIFLGLIYVNFPYLNVMAMMMMMNVLETGRYSVRELRNYCISEINLILSSVISHHLFCHQLGMKTIILSSTWYVNYHPVINLVCKLSLYLRWSWRYRQLMCIHIKHPADVKNFLQKQNKNHYQKCSFF